MVYDATHPYAVVVTENIRAACEKTGCRYVRILREDSRDAAGYTDARFFPDAETCAAALAAEGGNILLTTGSKELGVFARIPGLTDRIFARVLPSAESIGLCAEAGLEGRHIIAMHGPFSKDLNKALIDQYEIDILVTKETGKSGGYPEKIEACRESGIKAFVIGRPVETGGITVSEALAQIGARRWKKAEFNWAAEPGILVSLIGIGPGSPDLITPDATRRIEAADIIFGAPRMLEPFPEKTSYPYYRVSDVLPIVLDSPDASRFAVLFSGDSGFFSGTRKMKAGLEEGLSETWLDYEIEIIPGISSLSYFASRLGIEYSDAALMSIHGKKDPERAADALLAELKRRGKVFTLLSGKKDAVMLAEKLKNYGSKKASMFLGRDLSYPNEGIFMIDTESGRLIPDEDGCSYLHELPEGSYAAYLCDPSEGGHPVFPLLPDDAFERGKVPMTKEAVRHLSIARLELAEDSVLFDIGSGTGSISVQAASICDTIRVYAVEKKPEALELTRLNISRHRLPNVVTVEGEAPEALIGLEKPTHAFIGGSGGNLREILTVLRSKNPTARVVMNAVSLETIAEMTAAIKEFPVKDLTIEQVQVSRSRALGNYHLMTADNHVMICAFTFDTDTENRETV